jgi:hypothetical protein
MEKSDRTTPQLVRFIAKWQPQKHVIDQYYLGLNRHSSYRLIFMNFIEEFAEIAKVKGLTEYVIDDELENVWKFIDKELSKISLNKTKFLAIMLSLLENVSIDLFSTSIMDIYTMSRLFIKFDPSKMSRGPAGCTKNIEVKNAIIYAGNNHIDIYRRFLDEYFGVPPTISRKSDDYTQCMVFSPPFDYWA